MYTTVVILVDALPKYYHNPNPMFVVEDTWQKRAVQQASSQSSNVSEYISTITSKGTKDTLVQHLCLAINNLKLAGSAIELQTVLQSTELALFNEISHFWNSIFNKVGRLFDVIDLELSDDARVAANVKEWCHIFGALRATLPQTQKELEGISIHQDRSDKSISEGLKSRRGTPLKTYLLAFVQTHRGLTVDPKLAAYGISSSRWHKTFSF